MIKYVLTNNRQHITEIEKLRKMESGSLGFVPIQTYEHAIHNARIIIALCMGFVIGYCWFTIPSSHEGKIKQLMVHPEWRRMKIGTNLITSAVFQIQRYNPVGSVTLRCRTDLDAGNALWRRFPFQPVSEDLDMGTRGHRVVTWRWSYGPSKPSITSP